MELGTDQFYDVGPMSDMYDHGPVTIIDEAFGSPDGETFFVCLDCGYLSDDQRTFAHTECDAEQNGVTRTWREYLDDEGGLP